MEHKLIELFAKISQALKLAAIRQSVAAGISITQTQVLTFLHGRGKTETTLSDLADYLGVSLPTVSDSVGSLADKGLVSKARSQNDSRRVLIGLTPKGARAATQLAAWPECFVEDLAGFSCEEKHILYKMLMTFIRNLHRGRKIPLLRMCVSCKYFIPNHHGEPLKPHHCALMDAPLSVAELSLECPDHEAADEDTLHSNWEWLLLHPAANP